MRGWTGADRRAGGTRRPARLGPLLASVVALAMLLPTSAALAWTAEGGVVLTEPAVTGSLYQNHGPQAVYDEDLDVTYLAYFGAERDLRIMAYDHASETRRGPVTIGANPRWDNPHSAPSIDVTPDGHIHVAWGSHSSPILHARSDAPGSITDGWSQQPIATDPSVTESGGSYPLLVADQTDGTLAIVYRAGHWHDGPGTWSHEYGLMQLSHDGGSTWSAPKMVADSTRSYPHSDFYPSAATWHDDALHLTWTLAQGTDGRPHDVVRADIFHATYDVGGDVWSSLGGVDLGPSMDWDDMFRHARAIQKHGTGAARHHVGPEGVVLVAPVDNYRTSGAELFLATYDAEADADWDARNWVTHDTGIQVHDPHTAHHLLPDDTGGGWLAYVSAPRSLVRYRAPDGVDAGWEADEVVARSSHANPSGDRMMRSSQVRNGGPIDVFVQDGGWGWYGGSGWSAAEVARSRSPIAAIARPGQLDPAWAHWNALHYAHRWWYFGEPYAGLGVRQEGEAVRLKGFLAGDPASPPSASDPAPIAELAPEHRPAERHVFEVYDDDPSVRGRVDVGSDGWVEAARGEALSLDAVSFTTHDAGGWQPATLQPGWSRFQPGSDLTSPGVAVTDGDVRLKGFVAGDAVGEDDRILRLPPDLRPEHRHVFKVFATGAHFARVDVHPDGWVVHVEGGENLALDGITFPLDAGWQTPTLAAGWNDLGGDLTPAGYADDTDEDGLVHLRGFVRGPGPGSTILRLPPELRPSERQIFAVYRTGVPYADARVDVLPNGEVRHVRGGDWLSLDGLSFSVDR